MGKNPVFLRPSPMLRKQVGQFKKLFGLWENSNKNKLRVSPSVQVDGAPTFLVASKGIKTNHITRRQIVLNRHFTEIISDVLSVNLKRQLSDIGVTITSIESKAWNKGVDIFYTTDKRLDLTLHRDLNSLVSELRYAIAERRLIGRTPNVNFVYDESANMMSDLEAILKRTTISNEERSSDLVETSTNQPKIYKEYQQSKTELQYKQFSAPDDMSNIMLGLDYPSLYNEVAVKLERGRGESDRMISHASLASSSKPFIRGPPSNIDDEDPTLRVIRMQNFLVRQRKKSEFQSKRRRLEELAHRDRVKWDLPEEKDDEKCDSV